MTITLKQIKSQSPCKRGWDGTTHPDAALRCCCISLLRGAVMTVRCPHCHNGWFHDQRFGQDVECVNGVLIDIDVAHEGWQRDVSYPVAPCHPMWKRQLSGKSFDNDSQERLASWATPDDATEVTP